MPLNLHIDGTVFRDSNNKEVTIHGINVAGEAKFPLTPDLPSHERSKFFDADAASYVGRPFSAGDAPSHFQRLRSWGYNTLRFIFTWEAIEHAGPGIYDEDWIQHTIAVLRVAKDFGFYVVMDPHQDVWSRFTGGSGAPLWTIYACGLDPEKFMATEAALVQNLWPDPLKFPKMIWATNYTRLACQTIFTLFWAGRTFAPKAAIDGVNIQDYLQDHFIAACKHLAVRIKEANDLNGTAIIGWESVNEPNRGLVGVQDLGTVPEEQKLKKGTSATPWQAILLGSGRACEVETWDFGGMGPYKSGMQLVDPNGQSTWLASDEKDAKYGWKRGEQWHLGSCLWAQHGVWDPESDSSLRSAYFAQDPETGQTIDYEYFTNKWFMSYYRKYRDAIRNVFPDTIMFCQPPVLEIPPSIKATEDDEPNMVFSPHWYDGVTLMTKKWNRLWNVDVFGVLRGRYLAPAFAIKLGETAIRNCFRDQLAAIRDEGLANMGNRPCVFTELGIPYDMDDAYAYKTGDYTSQFLAMDANHFALEGNRFGFMLWDYCATNNHKWGDQWNGEDLSIYSTEDPPNPQTTTPNPTQSQEPTSPSLTGYPRALPAFARATPLHTRGSIHTFSFTPPRPGDKTARPTFTMQVRIPKSDGASNAKPTTTNIEAGDREKEPDAEIFLPEIHFPPSAPTSTAAASKPTNYSDDLNTDSNTDSTGASKSESDTTVDVTITPGSSWKIVRVSDAGKGSEQQRLHWWYPRGTGKGGDGVLRIEVKGPSFGARTGVGRDGAGESGGGGGESLWERCNGEKGCCCM